MTLVPKATRRDFLQLMAALGAQVSLTACRQREEAIVAQASQSSSRSTGEALHFATAITLMGTAFGVIVESRDARPTKIEGNPRHPESLGATNTFVQASLYDLYDPDRSREPRERGQPRTIAQANQMLKALAKLVAVDGGARFAILTSGIRSPTTLSQLATLRQRYPHTRVIRYEPLDHEEARSGAEIAFGSPLEQTTDWTAIELALVLDGDPFGNEGSPVRATHDWTVPQEAEDEHLRRLIVIESSISITGSIADHRFVCESHRILNVLSSLVFTLEKQGAISLSDELRTALTSQATLLEDPLWKNRLDVIGRDLVAHQGKSIVFVGARQPANVHALAHWLNSQLGNLNRCFSFWESLETPSSGANALEKLSKDILNGSVEQLLIIGSNPVFSAPGDVDFSAALKRIKHSVHVGEYYDETAKLCQWHINLAHELESFSDTQTRASVASIIQPLIAPLWKGPTCAELLADFLEHTTTAYDLVRANWRSWLGENNFESQWRIALLNGTVGDAPNAVEVPPPDEARIAEACNPSDAIPKNTLEAVFVPSHATFDGRFANNAWLQELPCPITTITWGNPAWISDVLASRLGLTNGQVIRLTVGNKTLSLPVVVVPGQAPNSITIALGQGHDGLGRIANGVGVNAFPLRSISNRWIISIDRIEAVKSTEQLARTQSYFEDKDRNLAREIDVATLIGASNHANATPSIHALGPRSREGRAWGLAIDLNRCTGCNACVVACQVENNIPVVGKEEISNGRAMHWMRVDRYFSQNDSTLRTIAQPILCQQCENAPCESVCPVGATAHSPEGLNDMVYNRCVGSRYCANNCPFKVRKFNFSEQNGKIDDLVKLRFNPEVTVRSRGVMEKCTFCVHRINRAKVTAKLQGKSELKDGDITTACAQACPASAIVFGDLNNANSSVSNAHRSPRSYRLLDELNLSPRVAYLAKLRNLNPEL